jgi:hypothetical protein
MRQSRVVENSTYGHFLYGDQFLGKRCCYVVFDLNLWSVPPVFRQDEAVKIARKFRNNLSRFYFRKAARKKKQFASVVAHLHTKPHFHIHILAEVPETQRFADVRDFTKDFVIRNYPLCVSRRKDKDGNKDQVCFFEPIENVIGASIYNNRFGTESCLLF